MNQEAVELLRVSARVPGCFRGKRQTVGKAGAGMPMWRATPPWVPGLGRWSPYVVVGVRGRSPQRNHALRSRATRNGRGGATGGRSRSGRTARRPQAAELVWAAGPSHASCRSGSLAGSQCERGGSSLQVSSGTHSYVAWGRGRMSGSTHCGEGG
jgi:hypothetical protein